MTKVVTRFAPSPTGDLHLGSARTALFNYLFAKKHGGQYLLRIEDTDRERSTPEAEKAILDALSWLELIPDQPPVYQFSRADRHKEIATKLIEKGHAYYCYTTAEDLARQREEAVANKQAFRYNREWRDRDPNEAPAGVDPVVRLKVPVEGETVVHDLVQGKVTVQNKEMDDFILLRSDGTPTYMLSVVVDDHDMGVTHIIRGDDHLNNTFKQFFIYEAMGWEIPEMAHIPLIHGDDGAKLSKRHGATSTIKYKDMGILPEAMCNYLLRLGWGHGDEEFIPRNQAIELFDIKGIGKSAARFDMAKLLNLNAHYLREADNDRLITLLNETKEHDFSNLERQRLEAGLDGLKQRAKTLLELEENARIYQENEPASYTEKAQTFLDNKELLQNLKALIALQEKWEEDVLHEKIKRWAEEQDMKLGKVAQTLRAALTGTTVSPSVFEVAAILGKEETLNRIQKAL